MHGWQSSRPVISPELELDVTGSPIDSEASSDEDDPSEVVVAATVVDDDVDAVDDVDDVEPLPLAESAIVVVDVGSGTPHSVSHVVLDPVAELVPSSPTTR